MSIVPSIMAYSKSGSPDNALKRIPKTPFTAQAAKAPEDSNSTAQTQDADLAAGRAGLGNPKNRFETAGVILAATTRIAGLARNQRRNLSLPLPIVKIRRIKARLLGSEP